MLIEAAIDPTLAAVLPLVGVAVGALLTNGLGHIRDRRKDRAEARAIARLFAVELLRVSNLFDDVLEDGRFPVGYEVDLATPRWDELAVRSAQVLSRDDWLLASLAFDSITQTRSMIEHADAVRPDAAEQFVRTANDQLMAAAVALLGHEGTLRDRFLRLVGREPWRPVREHEKRMLAEGRSRETT